MNATYFVLIAALLTFATGFFVASIIWGIKWFILSREGKTDNEKSVHLLHIFSRKTLRSEYAVQALGQAGNFSYDESAKNKELYQYYHGKN